MRPIDRDTMRELAEFIEAERRKQREKEEVK